LTTSNVWQTRAKRRRHNPVTATAVAPLGEWLPNVSPTMRWDWAHLRMVIDALQRVERGEQLRLIITMPPRHGKSELTTIRFPVWSLMRKPSRRVIVAAYNQTLANTFSRRARRIAEQAGLRLAGDRTAVEQWETRAGGGLRAVGVGGGVTGLGADLIVIDDPIKNRAEAESKTYRDRVWEWYRNDLYTRREPGAAIIVMLTRWHEDDLIGRLTDPRNAHYDPDMATEWEIINLPAEAGPNDPLGREVGAALCPDRFDVEELRKTKRVLGSYAYAALYQQQPAPVEGNIVKREWFQRYRQLPEAIDQWVVSVDLTYDNKTDGDYVAMHVWARAKADMYLVDRVHGQLDVIGQLASLRTIAERWPQARPILIERRANGAAVITLLRREIAGVVPIEPKGSKEARLRSVAPLIESGNVWLPVGPMGEAIIAEVCAFPNAQHDDDVDAMTQALNRFASSLKEWLR
jgi:predicted phage terminase large subunit-like protein